MTLELRNIREQANAHWKVCHDQCAMDSRRRLIKNVAYGVLGGLGVFALAYAGTALFSVTCEPTSKRYATYIYSVLHSCPEGEHAVEEGGDRPMGVGFVLGSVPLIIACQNWSHGFYNTPSPKATEDMCQKVITADSIEAYMQLDRRWFKKEGIVKEERHDRAERLINEYREVKKKIAMQEDPRQPLLQDAKQLSHRKEEIVTEFQLLLDEIKLNLPDPLGKITTV